jgi:hypothetical protein
MRRTLKMTSLALLLTLGMSASLHAQTDAGGTGGTGGTGASGYGDTARGDNDTDWGWIGLLGLGGLLGLRRREVPHRDATRTTATQTR